MFNTIEERDRQRYINYVDYLEKTIRIYSKSELISMTEMELLNLMPQNQIDEIRSGEMKVSLGESWDDRNRLELN